ncbi:MAG TPA: filamentous hemagglutinin N-terminal domain-containing protein [Nitrospiria bacterium]|jgi:filamentous hemagglutinin family protein|nr:filamentous hemagglutinin N-terminal domain-containing protein [Nitrospiria bacterium]
MAASGNWIPVFLLCAGLIFPETSLGNPSGPTVVSGGATVSGVGTSVVTVNQTTPKAILSWQQFNIAPNEVTRFIQPGTRSIALNRIFDANPSQIFGSLQANGSVILINPNGVFFGPSAQVNVGGLIASSLNLTDDNFLKGQYVFQGDAAGGAVKNAGTIQTGSGGYVFLFAPNVENSGLIKSPEGQILLAAGTSAYLTDRPDGQGFLVEVNNPNGEATNLKDLIADGGSVNIYARVINQEGLVQADSVREKDGRIELFASEDLNLANGSVLSARGDGEGTSNGGTIVATSDKATGTTRFDPGAVIDVSGGAQGGWGGSVELSGHDVTLGGTVRGGANAGYTGGRLLLDPYDLTVTQDDFDPSSGLSELDFQADHDITVTGALTDLSAWTVPFGSRGKITFTAGNDILFNDTFIINDIYGLNGGAPWDIVATAGRDFVLSNSTLGTGNGGNMTIQAGRNITAPSAFDNAIQLYNGLRLDTNAPGILTINAGGDFLGGFLVSNGRAHVTVGGNFGSADNNVNLTLGSGQLDVSAGQSVYLGLVQDKGLAEGVNSIYGNRELTADPGNAVSLTATNGDIHLGPLVPDGEKSPEMAQLRQYYPASFSASAPHGSIFIEANLAFWPSPTGRLDFFAQDAIQGTLVNGVPPTLKLIPADPDSLVGVSIDTDFSRLLNNPAGTISNSVIPVSFRTVAGNIGNLDLQLYSPTLRKQVTVQSGADITNFSATISVPDGVQGTVGAAGNIDMTPTRASTSGILFVGTGDGLVSTGGDLNLADSRGIGQRFTAIPTDDIVPEGLLEIAVGGNLEMTQSTIVTYNGAAIRIHGLDGPDSPVGGSVDIGTNRSTGVSQFGTYLGIMTLRGGEIDITATGDVNVNKSRVATFGGGDIRISSTEGNINAGSGGKDELVQFIFVDQVTNDQGNVITTYLPASVPGSGIFTFHPNDPDPLPDYPPPPPFQLTPELQALQNEIIKRRFLGRDTQALENQFKAGLAEALTAASEQYDQIKAEFSGDWKLGNIYLTAPAGDVVVPPAGIRGKTVSITAENLDLQGGAVEGNVVIDVDKITGDQSAITGPLSGSIGGSISIPISAPSSAGTGLGGLSGTTGSVSTSTAATSSAVQSAQDTVAEAAAPEEAQADGDTGKKQADRSKGKRNRKTFESLNFKKGVTIEVDVTENPG